MTNYKDAAQVLGELHDDAAKANAVTPFDKAQKETNEMYEIFKKEIDVDTVLTASEFDEYKPLFSKTARMEANEERLSVDEVLHYADLSQQFMDRVNTRRPIHVVDDYTKEELFTLPPIFNKLHPIDGDKAAIMDAYKTYNDPAMLQHGNPKVEAKREAIDIALTQSLMSSQPITELQQNMTEFETIAAKFHQTVIGDNPFADPSSTTPDKDATIRAQANSLPSPTEEDNNYDDDFEF